MPTTTDPVQSVVDQLNAIKIDAPDLAPLPDPQAVAALNDIKSSTQPAIQPFAPAQSQIQTGADQSVVDSLNQLKSTPLLSTAAAAATAAPSDTSTWSSIKSFLDHPLVTSASIPGLQTWEKAADATTQNLKDAGYPTASKLLGASVGTVEGAGQSVAGLTKPANLGLIAAGTLGAAAAPGVAALAALGFSAYGIYSAAANYPEIKRAIVEGRVTDAARLLTASAATVGMSAYAGLKSLGEVNPTETATNTAAAQPLRNAQVIKIVDSDAAKVDAERAQTESSNAQATVAPKSDSPDQSVVDGLDQIKSPSAQPGAVQPEAKTVPISKIVSDDAVPVISKPEILSEAAQRQINNSVILARILDPAKIKTPEDITNALAEAADHIQVNIDGRTGVTIGFDSQLQLASDLGMTVEDLLQRKAGQAFNTEQALASRMLLKSSADYVLDLARKAVAGNDDARTQLPLAAAQHQEIISQVVGVASEAGRSLGSFRISNSDLPAVKIAQAMSQLSPEALTKASQLLSKLDTTDPLYVQKANAMIQEITPSTTQDKLFEGYRNILLSSPSTMLKKGASEFSLMALEGMKKVGVGLLEQAKAATGFSDEPQAFASEAWWYAKGSARAMANAKTILNGEFDLNQMPGFESTGGLHAFKGAVGNVVRFPSEVLSRQSNLIYAANYYGEVEASAARQAISEDLEDSELAQRQHYLAENPSKQASQDAHEFALHQTFQQKLGKTGGAFQAAVQSNPVSKWLLPFVKTPINLLKTTENYSPLGLLRSTYEGDLNGQVKGILGSTIASAVAYLAAQGIVTGGGPINYRQEQTKETTGWQPYSVRLGDTYFSYHQAEPLGLLLATTADGVHSAAHDEQPEVVTSKTQNAMSLAARNVQQLPFLMQVSDIFQAVQGLGSGSAPERVIDNLLASTVVPAIMKNAAQTIDPTVRRPEREGWVNPATGLTQTIEERLPIASKNVPADISITGAPVNRPSSSVGGANPFPWTSGKDNPVTAELARLGFSVENTPIRVEAHGSRGKVVLTPTREEALKLQAAETAKFYVYATKAISNPQWPRLADSDKKNVLDRLHETAIADRFRALQLIRRAAAQ